ncbi:MAG: metallophosphoesterase [Deltaproteobacteria bacterium]|nr:metallophosphoesterase [Deltaproteobacteria bacterium]
MPRLAWTTDIHLDHLTEEEITSFGQSLAASGADGILIGGDIAQAPTLVESLITLATQARRPIYFVCGNHDYYYGSIAAVRGTLTELTTRSDQLGWLPARGCIPLSQRTGLVGHGSWNDGRAGSYLGSTVMLTDYLVIAELKDLGPTARLAKLNQLGDEAASHFAEVVPRALEHCEHLIVLTHVPPFAEACQYEGHVTSDDWLPHLSCVAAGETLARIMESHPTRKMTVLSGHTHHPARVEILPNLVVKTGHAVYGTPEIQELIEVA